MSINSLRKLVYYAKVYGKITSFNKLCLIFEQDVTGDLTTLTANSSRAFASQCNRQRQFPIIIRRNSGWVPVNFKAIWEYRELLYFLAWRDIKVRYKQMFLGINWALLQPLMLAVSVAVVSLWMVSGTLLFSKNGAHIRRRRIKMSLLVHEKR
jgi:hypothetical protein